MCTAREAMATTSLVGESESEKGLLGSCTVVGGCEGSKGKWTCSVESQDADIKSACSRL